MRHARHKKAAANGDGGPLIGPNGETAMIMGGYFHDGIFPIGTTIEALSVRETMV